MKSYARRALALLFCAIMLVSALSLTSCGKEKNPSGDNTSAVVTTLAPTTTEPVVTEAPFPIADENLDGYDFLIYEVGFKTSDYVNDFQYNEEANTVIDKAIYDRNVAVEDKFDITISNVQKDGTGTAGSTEGYGALMQEKTAGDSNYDAAVLPAYDQSLLAYNGANYNLAAIPYLDISSPYWDQQSVDNLTIKDMLFFMTGDCSIDIFNSTIVIAFNKGVAETKGVTDLYKLVEQGQWTMDKWIEYSMLVSEDLNGDTFFTEKDAYGSLIWDDAIYAVINGAGELCCDVDEFGDIVLTLGTERVISAFQKFVEFADKDYCLRFQQTFNATTGKGTNLSSAYHDRVMFPANQALFLISWLGEVNYFRDMETNYGILPIFKYSDEQESYYNTVAPFNARFLCVPVNQEDIDRTGKVLETIGYYSSKYITPAYYTKTLVGQNTRDDESLPMLELIRTTRVYDVGYFYQPANINKNLIYKFRAFDTNWASTYSTFEKPANVRLGIINEAFNTLSESWK